MVGVAGFEPATSRPPDARATKLRYTPTNLYPYNCRYINDLFSQCNVKAMIYNSFA